VSYHNRYSILQGITASLQTNHLSLCGFFSETTKVLNEAAVAGKIDYLEVERKCNCRT
jgi:DNA-directed RNA polymerase subunit beta'